jgi:hypothetical protein
MDCTAVGSVSDSVWELRMMKQFILFCVTLLAVAPVSFAQVNPAKPAKSASNETAITDLEKSAWEVYKSKQTDALKKLLSKDYCGAYADGIKNLGEETAGIDLREYSLADVKVVFPSADTFASSRNFSIGLIIIGPSSGFPRLEWPVLLLREANIFANRRLRNATTPWAGRKNRHLALRLGANADASESQGQRPGKSTSRPA